MNQFEQVHAGLLDEGISNIFGIKPKAERKAKRAAKKQART